MIRQTSYCFQVSVEKLVSENERLNSGIRKGRGGRSYSFLYTPPNVKAFQKTVEEQIREQFIAHNVTFDKSKKYTLFTTFIMPKSVINKRDTSNYIKVYEDGFKKGIELDDNRYFTHVITKLCEEDCYTDGLNGEIAFSILSFPEEVA